MPSLAIFVLLPVPNSSDAESAARALLSAPSNGNMDAITPTALPSLMLSSPILCSKPADNLAVWSGRFKKVSRLSGPTTQMQQDPSYCYADERITLFGAIYRASHKIP